MRIIRKQTKLEKLDFFKEIVIFKKRTYIAN
jgi:hypothetical protein